MSDAPLACYPVRMRPLNLAPFVLLASCVFVSACAGTSQGDNSPSESEAGASTTTESGPSSTATTNSATGSETDTGSESSTDTSTDTGTDTDTDTDTGTDTGEPGEALGEFQLTYYWVSYEGDFDPPADTDIGTCGGETIATVPLNFANALRLEGSGRLLDERVVNVGGCSCAGGYDCFAVLDPEQFPWGQGSQANALVPFASIATDTDVLPFGTSLYVPALDGVLLPGGGGTHDGCLRAADVGGGINGMHFDWFVGLRDHYLSLDPRVPGQVQVLEGGSLCP